MKIIVSYIFLLIYFLKFTFCYGGSCQEIEAIFFFFKNNSNESGQIKWNFFSESFYQLLEVGWVIYGTNNAYSCLYPGPLSFNIDVYSPDAWIIFIQETSDQSVPVRLQISSLFTRLLPTEQKTHPFSCDLCEEYCRDIFKLSPDKIKKEKW